MDLFGNPSSSHALGLASKEAYEASRRSVAALVGRASTPEEVVLLSCGTESINYCLRGACHAARASWGGDHLVVSSVEHDAVLATAKHLEQDHGFKLTVVPVDAFGEVTAAAVKAACTPATVLVSVMHANNEVGTVNDLAAIAAALKEARTEHIEAAAAAAAAPHPPPPVTPPILLHSDTSQSLGKVPVDAAALGVDYLTVTGHKLYGPKGIGALWVSQAAHARLPLRKLMHGASHELGRRAGTESTLLAAGLGAACDLAAEALARDSSDAAAQETQLAAGCAAGGEGGAADGAADGAAAGALPAVSVGLAVCRDRLEKRLLDALGPDMVRPHGRLDAIRTDAFFWVSFCQV
jgi:cysteine desulfurase